MDAALLHNSKAGDVEFAPEKLLKMLRKRGIHAAYYPLKQTLADSKHFGKLVGKGKLLIVAGGDGSIRKVATRLNGSKSVLAPLPIGTANNIARSLGIVGTPEEIIAGWKHGVKRKIDLGVAVGPWGKRYFIEGIGLGLIGRSIAIVDDIDALSGRVFSTKEDKMHRDLCVMAALAHEMPPTSVSITFKNAKTTDDYLLLELLNIGRVGPGIELSTDADCSDGKLDLVWATAHDRRALSQNIEKCLSEARYGPNLRAQKVRRLKLAVGKCELRMDDKVVLRSEDFSMWTKDRRVKIEVRVKPEAVTFLIPPPPPPAPTGLPGEAPSGRRDPSHGPAQSR